MSGKSISVEDMKTYLGCIVDCELSVYTQRNLIARMEKIYNSLALRYRIDKPELKEETYFRDGFQFFALVGGVIGAIIGAIYGFVDAMNSYGGFFGFLAGLWVGFCFAVMLGLVGAVIVGLIGGCYQSSKNAKHNQEVYEKQMVEYERKVNAQNARIERETKQKKALAVEINEMKQNLYDTRVRLTEIYDYNVIHEKYHDVYSVSAFLDYFSTGRTYSLKFNPDTGDRGAYNIYEDEKRQNLIIMNLYEIIQRLDEIADTQREIARGIERANRNIEGLHNDVKTYLNKMSNSMENIERCESLQAYNTEQINYELKIMNWMNYTLT